MKRARVIAPLLALCGLLPATETYRASLEAWHRQRIARLAAEDGWLTLIGLDWLKPGENTLGSAPGSTVLLPGWAAPAQAGRFLVEGTTVRFHPLPDSGLLLNGKPATESLLKSDMDGSPDLLSAGRVRFHVIRRGARLGVRIKDSGSPARRGFKGVPRYPVNRAWQVVARFVPYAVPQTRAVPTVLGTMEPMTAPGLLKFRVAGQEVVLEPMIEDPGSPELFVIFSDATSAHGSYAAGRFLYADMPREGKVILDFNRAVNPPCAFTMFATCPLPPEGNRLKIPIPAGEKDPGLH